MLAVEQVTLVFPAAYLNNPSSMFGHTLLRLDRAGQDERTRLLSYAVNYGAEVGDDNGLLFAIHGLTGGYPGTYSIMPYYLMVQRYSDFENRDLWEYQLDLRPAEITRLLQHLWELRTQSSDYFFFDENCSYQLLFLLDVARPDLQLTDRFPLHAIPADTVRAVVGQDGMLERVVFRPSSRTRIEHGLRSLEPDERVLLERLAAGEPGDPALAELEPGRRAAVLELAAEVVTYRLRTGALTRDEAAGRAWHLLATRSAIATSADLPPAATPAIRPDQGHGSARVALGLGVRDGRRFASLQVRPVYHDLSDAPGGYVPGAAIEALDLELRHYEGDSGPTLEALTLVGIRSLSARNEVFRPVSWRLGAGLTRFRGRGEDEKGALIGSLEGGLGPAFGLGDDGLLSLLAEAGIGVGGNCPETCFFAIGPGVTLVWRVLDRWTVLLEGRAQALLTDPVGKRLEVQLGQSFRLSRNLAIKIDASVGDEGGGVQTELGSSLHWYF